MDFIDAVMPRSSEPRLPQGACDAHNHVFGPFERWPLAYPPDYPMPLAPIERYLEMLDRTGLDRGLLVQPTQQDCETDIMLHALAAADGRLRGVASARPDVADDTLEKLSTAGVTGLRFVEAPLPSGAPRPGAVDFGNVAALAGRMRDLNWSINAWARMSVLIDNLDKLLAPELPVVFEHMGMLDPAEGIQGDHFQTMLALLREGRIWIKLSVCRCSTMAPTYDDLRPFTEALIDANADQLLWGSDWPFIRMQDKEPDVASLAGLLIDWLDDAALVEKIFCDNPARLYGFNSE